MANTVECPACTDSWPATEADLGLRHCSVCGAELEVTRHPVYYVAAQQWWHYDATEVTAVKADDATKARADTFAANVRARRARP